MKKKRTYRILVSGGGTGGHINPALSIADALKEARPETEILFVGAEGRMEAQKVPAHGYPIRLLPIEGLQRGFSFESVILNLFLPWKILHSLTLARDIIRDFKPDMAIGVGGYASYPTLKAASLEGIPTVIQEQNSFAGKANKKLGRKAALICTAYQGMERFFPAEKILLTGNPCRQFIRKENTPSKEEALKYFGLSTDLPTVLIVGGSLGCGTFNRTMREWCRENGFTSSFQVIWQSGGGSREVTDGFFNSLEGADRSGEFRRYGHVVNCDFIDRMDLAFAAADLVVSRAGAGTISELCIVGKASILVPSPNVAEDHQTHNALALVNKGAALMVSDAEAPEKLMETAGKTVADAGCLKALSEKILTLAKPDAAAEIAEAIFKILDDEN